MGFRPERMAAAGHGACPGAIRTGLEKTIRRHTHLDTSKNLIVGFRLGTAGLGADLRLGVRPGSARLS